MSNINKKEAEKEFKTLQDTKSLLKSAEVSWWLAADNISKVIDRKGYIAAGYATLQDYCEDGLGYSYKMIMQLVRAYDVAVKQFGCPLDKLPQPSKVYIVAEMMEKNPKQAEEWLEKARVLTADDLRKLKTEAKLGKDQMQCEHKNYIIIKVCQCKDCNFKWRDYGKEEKDKQQKKGK